MWNAPKYVVYGQVISGKTLAIIFAMSAILIAVALWTIPPHYEDRPSFVRLALLILTSVATFLVYLRRMRVDLIGADKRS